MKKIVLMAALAAVLTGCQWGNLGFYVYPHTVATAVSEEQGPVAGMEVVGYLLSSRIPHIDPAQARHLTDLVYFSVSARSDGTLSSESLTPVRLDFLKAVKRQYGTRILLSVINHSSRGPMAALVKDPAVGLKFAAALTDFLLANGFDGADFDWEFPPADELDAFAVLLTNVHEAFTAHGLKLSVAVSPVRPLTPAAYAVVDRVHAMLYDDDGRHSTLENSAAHVQELVKRGVPRAKLLLGIPFYGRGYTESRPWSSAISYKTLRERYHMNPAQDTVSGYYFNNLETIRQKVYYAKSEGLAGVVVWEIGQDTDDDTSLLGAITAAREDVEGLN